MAWKTPFQIPRLDSLSGGKFIVLNGFASKGPHVVTLVRRIKAVGPLRELIMPALL